MSDLDPYLTEEVVEKAARAEWEYEWPDRPWEKTPDDLQDFYRSAARVNLSAVLPDIIREVKAEALEAARGPYRCCPHCVDDLIHDVEKDDHTVPCELCQNDIIRQAKAEALRETANDDELWRLTEGEQWLLDAHTPYYEGVAYGFRVARSLLKDHADQIEAER